MAVWLVRAGSHGEYEQKFLQEKRIYLTWDKLAINLAKLPDREALFTTMTDLYRDSKPKRLHNWVSQVWPFAHSIKRGDLIVLPLKSQPSIISEKYSTNTILSQKAPTHSFIGFRSSGLERQFRAHISARICSIRSVHS